MRLDQYLVQAGIVSSRAEAQRAVKEGRVLLGGKTETKCAAEADDSKEVKLLSGGCPFVSRGGEKLQGALSHFRISVHGMTALDVGASTGGFTDCLLQNGAARVYALENGSGQLHARLLEDSRVVNMEHINARSMTKELFDAPIHFVCMDVSFISQKLILPAVVDILEEGGGFVTLIKPQFEVGRAKVGKGGIVKDVRARAQAVDEVVAFAGTLGFLKIGLMESPIRGGDGNVEYLAYFIKRKGA